MTTLNVKVENGVVTQVWDTPPPAGEEGLWFPAVEVNLPIPNRQGKHGHSFDLTKNPVEIVYDIYDISVEDRKANMTANAGFMYDMVVRQSEMTPPMATEEDVTAALARKEAALAAIDAAATHDDLDAIAI